MATYTNMVLNKNTPAPKPTNAVVKNNAPKPQVTNYATTPKPAAKPVTPVQPVKPVATTAAKPAAAAPVAVDPTKLTGKDERYYRQTNPYSDYTKSVDMDHIQKVADLIKNNQGVSADQMTAYKTNLAKWNMQDPNAPKVETPEPFQFSYDYMNYDTARGQAEQQFNPLYEQAVKNIQAQQYQNEMDSGEIAANRGIAQSGLAADALNKIKIASQGQIASANAQKMSQVAALAQQLMQQDQQRGDSLYQRAYQQYRDSIGDTRYADETTYNRGIDSRNFDYQKAVDSWNQNRLTGRDARSDFESDRGFTYQQGRDARRDAEWEITTKNDQYWKNNLTASEKAQYDWLREQLGEELAMKYFLEMKGIDSQSAASQAELDFYKNGNFNGAAEGGDNVNAPKGSFDYSKYKISSPFGVRVDPFTGKRTAHNAIDIAMPKGAPVGSTAGGTVVFAGFGQKGSGYGGYGNVVVVRDAQGNLHQYSHLDSIGVKKGDKVGAGFLLGKAGSTGRSTGPHLDYKVTNPQGAPLNPTGYIKG